MSATILELVGDQTLLIPDSLPGMRDARSVMQAGAASIYYKCIPESMTAVEFYTNRPCLAYVIAGEETFYDFDGAETLVRPGELFFMPGNLFMVSDFIRNDGALKAFLFFFDDAVIERFLASGQARPDAAADEEVSPYKIAANDALSAYMKALYAVYDRVEATPEMVRLKLLELLHLIEAVGDRDRLLGFLNGARRNAGKRNLRQVLRDCREGNLTLGDVAQLSGRSPARLNRDFQRQFGTSPKQYLIDARLERAHALLLESGMSVTEIANDVGYGNVSHFIKMFKGKYGKTPKKLRQHIP